MIKRSRIIAIAWIASPVRLAMTKEKICNNQNFIIMKNRIVFFFIMFILFSINDSFAQKRQNEIEEIVVSSGPGKRYPLKKLHVFNGVLVKDSVMVINLINDSKNFKTKSKIKKISVSVQEKMGLDTESYSYFLEVFEIKDVIIDPETMKLIKIK